MTETSPTRSGPVSSPSYATTGSDDVSGWAGWVVFAGIMLIMLGAFQVIEGLVALFDEGYYLVAPSGLVLSVDYNTWGWVTSSSGSLPSRQELDSSPATWSPAWLASSWLSSAQS